MPDPIWNATKNRHCGGTTTNGADWLATAIPPKARRLIGDYARRTGTSAFLVRKLLASQDRHQHQLVGIRDVDPIRNIANRVGERIAAGLGGSSLAAVESANKARSGEK